jgi:hypothetical protein
VPSLDEKRENAIAAAKAMITLLERCREFDWAARIYPILDSLEAYDLDNAVARYAEIPMPNMGGFLDLVLSQENGHIVRDYNGDNQLLDAIRGALGKTIANLRIYIKHEFDHPLVAIPDAT